MFVGMTHFPDGEGDFCEAFYSSAGCFDSVWLLGGGGGGGDLSGRRRGSIGLRRS
jgi:hypothetical protein